MKPHRTVRLSAVPVAVLFFVLVFAWSAGPAAALVSTGDGSWFWRTPQPFGSWLVAAASVGDTAWACGDGGAVVVSHDDGVTWSLQHSGTEAALYDVVFLDALTGWAVGGSDPGSASGVAPDNVILHTADGGETWSGQTAPGQKVLVAVTFIDATHGWAVGASGTVLRTADGGVTWVRRPTGTAEDLTAVHFTDELHGWVGGLRGAVLRTADGGLTWRRAALPDWARRLRVLKPAFTDALHGYAIFGDPDSYMQFGSGRFVGATADGGRTWTRVAGGVQFTAVGADAARVWTAGNTAHDAVEYAVSTDGGGTWSRQIVNGTLPDDIVAVGDGACSVAGGGAFSSADGEVWLPRTSVSWTPEDLVTLLPDGTLLGLVTDWTSGYSTTQRSLTSKDGISWEPGGALGGGMVPIALEAAGDGRALAACFTYGFTGKLLATTDSGASWTTLLAQNESIYSGVSALDASHVWVCGIAGARNEWTMSFTSDWGQTWQDQSLPAGYFAFSVDFISPTEGWAAAWGESDAVMVHTVDGGVHWQILEGSRSRVYWEQVHFADALHGWALGMSDPDSGRTVMYATRDGGLTWSPCTPGVAPGEIIGGFAFADAEHGWAWDEPGNGVAVWRTSDGGATWAREWTGAGWGVANITPVGGDAFAVSPFMGVLSTQDLVGDVAPPYTYDDFDKRDHRTSVAVALRAADVGGEIASTEYRVDDDPTWQPYTGPVAFDAPTDHSNDGRHRLHYRSTDTNGNVETDYAVGVGIDTLGPATAMTKAAVVRSGGRARVSVRIDDAVSYRAKVTLRFQRLGDGRPARAVREVVRTNKTQVVPFTARMSPGRYRVTVLATDDAGNPQRRAGRGLLTVLPGGRGVAATTASGSGVAARAAFAQRLESRLGPAAARLLELLGLDGRCAAQSRSARSWPTVTNR